MKLLLTLLLVGWPPLQSLLNPTPPGGQLMRTSRNEPSGKPAPRSSVQSGKPKPIAASMRCDSKLYGIAAMIYRQGNWEDDCRSIHEFSTSDLSAKPTVHRRVLPFQSYALAKGFDNCLYSVTKAPSDAAELVYRYDPTTRKGSYTPWLLPPQGPENCWISAATDELGDLYFVTSDASKLVKVHPADGKVTVIWKTDPLVKAPYYPTIGFTAAGTHGNFCLDDAATAYFVYSTDGSLLKVNINTKQPSPERMLLQGLPVRGGYSDVLMQNDAQGRRRMYLAGPKALYEVDLARRQARQVRRGTYTDLAGCNLFPAVAPQAAPAPPAAPVAAAGAVWRGKVLDASTRKPLPAAYLRIGAGASSAALPLGAEGNFVYAAEVGRLYPYRVDMPGYLPADSSWTAVAGPSGRDVLLRPLVIGSTVALQRVQFDRGQAALRGESAEALNQLVRLLQDNPRMTIELRGHTDNVGSPEQNVALSERRVQAVKGYLLGQGIAEARVTGKGLGGSEPTASNANETTRRINRRVEFRITAL